jgi:hypothetical protein
MYDMSIKIPIVFVIFIIHSIKLYRKKNEITGFRSINTLLCYSFHNKFINCQPTSLPKKNFNSLIAISVEIKILKFGFYKRVLCIYRFQITIDF